MMEPRWVIESCNAGMGETEYRLFRFGVFFCQTPSEREAQQIILWNEIFRYDTCTMGYPRLTCCDFPECTDCHKHYEELRQAGSP